MGRKFHNERTQSGFWGKELCVRTRVTQQMRLKNEAGSLCHAKKLDPDPENKG